MNGSVQERHNSTANGMELHLSCTNPSIYGLKNGSPVMSVGQISVKYM